MYNILLTDDEQIMIDSLSFIIDKNFPGQVKLFSALSGSDALSIVEDSRIDIIFMDINMPELNGLETLKYITQSKPDIVTVILSAFDRFQYAQEAVNLGAYKYLTKPVNRNVVIETVRGAMELVDRKRGKFSSEVELHKKLDFVSPMVESDFIYSAVFSRNRDITDYLKYFNITDSFWCFCCMEIPHLDMKNQYSLYMKIRDTLTSRCRCLIGSFMQNRLVVFFPVPADGEKDAAACHIHEQLKILYTLLSINVCSGIRAGVSLLESDQTRTSAAYSDALEALNSTSAAGGIIFASDVEKTVSAKKSAGEVVDKIFNRIRIGDAGGASPLVSEYCTVLQQQYGNDLNKVKNALFELLVNVRNLTTEIDAVYQNVEYNNAFAVLSGENDMQNIEQFVQKRCSECAADILKVLASKENPIIEEVCLYIDKNMSKDISLESAAAAVHVSPFYLSKLFKEEKGENFVAYITDMRLDKARDLLKESRASVKEVSIAVGYNDQNYFSRIFRSKFGMPPTEFRDISAGGNKEA